MNELMPVETMLANATEVPPDAVAAPPSAPPLSRWHFVAALQGAEAALATLLCLLLLGRLGGGLEPGWQGLLRSGLACLALAAAIVSVHRSFGAYDFGLLLRPLPSAGLSLAAWSVFLVPAWVLGLEERLGQAEIGQRLHAGGFSWWLAGGVGLAMALRLGFAFAGRRLHRRGLLGDNVVVVGTAAEAEACAALLAARGPGVTVSGHVVMQHGTAAPRAGGLPLLGALPDLPRLLRDTRVDEVVVALPPGATQRLPVVEETLRCMPARVSLGLMDGVPEEGTAGGGRRGLVLLGSRRLAGWGWVYKEIQDRILALLAIIAFGPLMLVIAAGIRLSSPGSALFRQVRRGYGGAEFEILKFRTMHAAPSQAAPEALRLTARDDPRIFRFGKFLRKTSLDELPQLFNVLLGDMWLIGPRPHPPFARAAGRLYADVVGNYAARHWVKPGLTGWAQINGWRGPTETAEQIEQRVAHDLHYIENWSPGLDLQILLRTATRGFVHENAF